MVHFLVCTFMTLTQKILVLQHWDTSHLKAVNLAVIMCGSTCLWLSYIPRCRWSKMQKKILVFLLLTPFGNSAQILKWKDKKVVFWIFYPPLNKFHNGPLKIKKSKIQARHIKFYVDLKPKWHLGPRDPIIGSMGYGGGV